MLRKQEKPLTCTVLATVMVFSAFSAFGMSSTVSAGTDAPAFLSARSYGGEYTDAFLDVEYTKDNGFVAMGYTMGDSSDPEWDYTEGTNASSAHTNNDALLVKYDGDYNLQWTKAYGTTGVDIFNDLTVLKDGRIAVVGRQSFNSSDSKIKNVSMWVLLINPDNPDDYIEYHIGGTSGDQGFGIAATSDGGFVVGGWSASKEGYYTVSSNPSSYEETIHLWESADGSDDNIANRVSASASDSVIIKFDADGSLDYCTLHNYEVTENAYNISSPAERLVALAVDSRDDILISGYGSVAKNVQNAVIAKFHGEDGTLEWHRSAGSADMTKIPADAADYQKASYNSIAVLADNSYVLVGTTTNDATTEEGWSCLGATDSIIVHYSSSGDILHTENVGTINESTCTMEGAVADPSGGYIVYGCAASVMQEDALIDKGYDWGNYGATDGILIKYSANDEVEWCENYGTKNGDWINGAAISSSGEILAVGESNGKNGNPAWTNHGGIDAILMCTNLYDSLYTEPVNGTADGDVIWEDGIYTASGDGYAGNDSVTLTLTVSGGVIASVENVSNRETSSYFELAEKLFHTIVEENSCSVDTVSGATMSSNGILEAAEKCLAQAAAKYVDTLTDSIAQAETDSIREEITAAAVDAYRELGTLSVSYLEKEDDLRTAAESFGLSLISRVDAVSQLMTETLPEKAGVLTYNDIYYKLQEPYLNNIHASAFAENGITGEGIKIAVIDSGITSSHKDLNYDHILPGYDYDNGCSIEQETLIDNLGHGTAVAGILSATADNALGVAGIFDQVDIIPLKLSPVNNVKKPEESLASSQLVAQAIRDAVDLYEADVITTSLSVVDCEELAVAVAYAETKGVIITGAAGNSSSEDSIGEDDYIYPASYDSVISVGAVDAHNQVRTTSQKNDQLFVTAPGENIVLLDISRNAKCTISSGTSYASPLVAAMAVAAKQLNPNIDTAAFKILLKASAQDAGDEGYDTSYGYGIVDYAAFLNRFSLQNAIVSIPDADAVTLEDADTISAARTACDQMSEEEKELIPEAVNNLRLAESALAALSAEKDNADAQEALKEAQEALAAALEKLSVATDAALAAENKTAAAEAACKEAESALADALEKLSVATDAALAAENKNAATEAALKDAESALAAAIKKLSEAETVPNGSGVPSTDSQETISNLQKQIDVLTVQTRQIAKVKAKAKKSGKAVIRWKSLGSGYTYQIYRSTKLNTGYKKITSISKAKATVKKLKKGKIYYFKVRGCKKMNGKTVYTAFSVPVRLKAK